MYSSPSFSSCSLSPTCVLLFPPVCFHLHVYSYKLSQTYSIHFISTVEGFYFAEKLLEIWRYLKLYICELFVMALACKESLAVCWQGLCPDTSDALERARDLLVTRIPGLVRHYLQWTTFSNWKDGVARIRKHVQSDHHTEAHSALYILSNQTKDIDELLDIGHASKKPGNWKILLTVLQNVRFLAKQGFPLRGETRRLCVACKEWWWTA